MMDVEVGGPTNVLCDNKAIVCNTTHPKFTLKKKHNAIVYHRAHEAQAAGIVRIAKEDGASTNLADLFTKSLAGSDAPLAQAFWHKVIW